MFVFYLSGLWYGVIFKVRSNVSGQHAVSIFRAKGAEALHRKSAIHITRHYRPQDCSFAGILIAFGTSDVTW